MTIKEVHWLCALTLHLSPHPRATDSQSVEPDESSHVTSAQAMLAIRRGQADLGQVSQSLLKQVAI